MSENQTPPETLADPAVISEGTSVAPFSDTTDRTVYDAASATVGYTDVRSGTAPAAPCFLCNGTRVVLEQVTPQCVATKACPACRPE